MQIIKIVITIRHFEFTRIIQMSLSKGNEMRWHIHTYYMYVLSYRNTLATVARECLFDAPIYEFICKATLMQPTQPERTEYV